MRASTIFVQDVIPGLDVVSATARTTEPFPPATAAVSHQPSDYFQPDLSAWLDAAPIKRATANSQAAAPSYHQNGDLLREYLSTADNERKIWLRNRLLEANAGLVASVTMPFAAGNTQLHRQLMSDGQLALLSAITKCDPDRVELFASYAAAKIRSAALEFLRGQHNGEVLPPHAIKRLGLIRRAILVLADRNGLSTEDLGACAAQFSDEEIAAQANLFKGTVENLRAFIGGIVHLDQPIDTDDGSATVSDVTPAEADSPAEMATTADDRDATSSDVELAIAQLKPKAAQIVRMHFGIGCEALSQTEIGVKLGVSRQRITFVLQSALADLRAEINRMASLRRVAAKGLTLRRGL